MTRSEILARIERLLERRLTNPLTPAEQAELEQLYAQEMGRPPADLVIGAADTHLATH
jgi:hypothetical protein